ncbi:hypothetical protein F0P94_16485 [Adhaeribacter soli]|uniref:Uncharacterized protein n=1 Tax=Adhaeribacter soli TaxID=2607655 RepID=A0A5N1IMP5_9BACT|nr:hypothetical protein F0P94_16485 [Adhaeribacter soli]
MFLGTLFLFVSGQQANAQRPLDFEMKWKNGILVLTNGDTIRGAASITLPHDLVVITSADSTVTSAIPANIRSLEVSDEQMKVTYRLANGPIQQRRIYKTFIWDRDNAYSNFRSPALFVMLVSGKHSLLLREERYERAPGQGRNLGASAVGAVGGVMAEQVTRMAMNQFNLTEKFYLLSPNQELKWLRQPKKDLLAYFPEKKKEIMQFATQNNLSFTKPEHLARIVEFCNRF